MSHQVVVNTMQGALKLLGLPERAQFTDLTSFVKWLVDSLIVEVPIEALGVIFSDTAPEESARDSVWINRRSNGEISGVFVFQLGKWRPLYLPAPGQFYWVSGDSQNYDPDFTVILAGDDVIPPEVVTNLMNEYVPDGAGGYSKFAVRYSPV